MRVSWLVGGRIDRRRISLPLEFSFGYILLVMSLSIKDKQDSNKCVVETNASKTKCEANGQELAAIAQSRSLMLCRIPAVCCTAVIIAKKR